MPAYEYKTGTPGVTLITLAPESEYAVAAKRALLVHDIILQKARDDQSIPLSKVGSLAQHNAEAHRVFNAYARGEGHTLRGLAPLIDGDLDRAGETEEYAALANAAANTFGLT